MPPSVEAWSLKHWLTREISSSSFCSATAQLDGTWGALWASVSIYRAHLLGTWIIVVGYQECQWSSAWQVMCSKKCVGENSLPERDTLVPHPSCYGCSANPATPQILWAVILVPHSSCCGRSANPALSKHSGQ